MVLISVPVFKMSGRDDPDRKLQCVESNSAAAVLYVTAVAQLSQLTTQLKGPVPPKIAVIVRRDGVQEGFSLTTEIPLFGKRDGFPWAIGQQCPLDTGGG